ncbi:MAG: LacI family DNA-binding transcriptional regulator [Lachnospiraceae bacterium]|jgi:LacI family sucrose operon transcriptional repressor|nr:LacI family DNA-binding transcriptional regulator [Lachnospiraceae bacterium]
MTIKDIAKEAGVSSAAVSRYFNGGSLGKDKQEVIRKVVEKYGYTPNQTAHSMRTGKSGQIGVIVPKIHSDSLSQVMHGIADELHANDYTLILGITEGDPEREVNYIKTMQVNRMEGIILMGTSMTPHLKNTIDHCDIPIVVTGQAFKGVSSIYYDDFNAMKDLATLMLKKRKKLAYIGATESDPAVGIERKKGVLKAIANDGGNPDDLSYVISEGFEISDGYNAMNKLLKSRKKIDGVLCATDTMAIGAMQAMKEKGIKLPDDISIAAIGNSLAGKVVTPELTTVRLYFEECGKTAVQLLTSMIRSEDYPVSQTKMGYEIIERRSI